MQKKTPFKKFLREKKAARGVSFLLDKAASEQPPAAEEAVVSESTVSAPSETAENKVEVYTDVSVCRVLRIKRRVLAAARTAATKGRDWDAVGEEVGMTMLWIQDYALEHHIVPDFFIDGLEKVLGKYVSVRCVGTTPNKGLVQVMLEATGTREFARVRNVIQYPIHYKEVFGCVRVNMPADPHLEWIAAPNEVRY